MTKVAVAPPVRQRTTLDEKQQARLLAASEQFLEAKSRVVEAEAAVARGGAGDDRGLRRLHLLRLRLEIARRDYDATLGDLGFPARQPT